MFNKDRWNEILEALNANRIRTLITAFGVFWGIMILVLLLALTNGLKNGVTSDFNDFATNSIFMWSQGTSMPYKGLPKGRRYNFKVQDVDILKEQKVDFEFDGDMQPDVALNSEYEELYPFSNIVGKANILIMPGQHSAAISYKLMKTLGETKVIGPLLIGLGLPIEIAPLRSSTSELINLASVAAYSADVIDYKKN